MKNKIFLLLLIALFSACAEKQLPSTSCPLIPCSDIFVYITVKFVNSNNDPIAVSGYQILDLRTGKVIKTEALPLVFGTYGVADDSDLKQFSTQGDSVLVTASDSSQTKAIPFKIAGGCNCHVIKISGPDTVKFN